MWKFYVIEDKTYFSLLKEFFFFDVANCVFKNSYEGHIWRWSKRWKFTLALLKDLMVDLGSIDSELDSNFGTEDLIHTQLCKLYADVVSLSLHWTLNLFL